MSSSPSGRDLLLSIAGEIETIKLSQITLSKDVDALKRRFSSRSGTAESDNRLGLDDDIITTQAEIHSSPGARTTLTNNSVNNLNVGLSTNGDNPHTPGNQPQSGNGRPPLPEEQGASAAVSASTGTGQNYDLHAQYWSLSDSLKHVRLAPHMVLKDSHGSFKRDLQTTAKVVSRSARFVETGLKVLSFCQDTKEVDDLKLVFQSQLEFLKTEYSCLVVANDNDKDTASNYRRIKSGTTGMSNSDLQDLKLAHQMTVHSNNTSADSSNIRQRGGYRGRYPQTNYSNQRGGRFNNRYHRQNSMYDGLITSNAQLPIPPGGSFNNQSATG